MRHPRWLGRLTRKKQPFGLGKCCRLLLHCSWRRFSPACCAVRRAHAQPTSPERPAASARHADGDAAHCGQPVGSPEWREPACGWGCPVTPQPLSWRAPAPPCPLFLQAAAAHVFPAGRSRSPGLQRCVVAVAVAVAAAGAAAVAVLPAPAVCYISFVSCMLQQQCC